MIATSRIYSIILCELYIVSILIVLIIECLRSDEIYKCQYYIIFFI